MTEAGPSTVTLIGLFTLLAALPVALITAPICIVMNSLAPYFAPIVLVVIGATIAFAGALL